VLDLFCGVDKHVVPLSTAVTLFADPPGLDMYIKDKSGNWRSVRGSSKNETFNNAAGLLFSSSHAEATANLKFSLRSHRYNKKIDQRVEGHPDDGAMNPVAVRTIDGLREQLGLKPRFPYFKDPAKHLTAQALQNPPKFGFCGPSTGNIKLTQDEQDFLVDHLSQAEELDPAVTPGVLAVPFTAVHTSSWLIW
jgi:hypothetical protein